MPGIRVKKPLIKTICVYKLIKVTVFITIFYSYGMFITSLWYMCSFLKKCGIFFFKTQDSNKYP